MDLKPNFIANPEKADIITTDELAKVIPTFNWSGGHSGRLLNEEHAKQLDSLLGKYLVDISDKIDGTTINAFDLPNGL